MSSTTTAPCADVAAARRKVLDAYRAHLSVGLANLAELMHAGVELRSSGPYVWDEAGERYLDCGGYGVFTLGHCHPRVVEAVVAQVRTHPTATYFLLNRSMAEAAQALVGVTPKGLDQVFFGLGGAEAVETALKLARMNGRRRIVAMENGYHGMTLGALSGHGCHLYRDPFQPLLEDVQFVPFGNARALDEALASGGPACVILEPVQGEAGVIVPPEGFLRDVERTCRAHGAIFVLDEIQTGLGRLGTWWGADREQVTPDIILAGKALSGGVVPVSAAIGSARVFEGLGRNPLLHTSTFSGAPIATVAAKATIEAMQEEDVVGRAAALAGPLRTLVSAAIQETCATLVRDVRSAGLLVAIEWDADFLALDFMIEMLDRRVILSHSMNTPRVTRLTPPAILGDSDLEMLDRAIRSSGHALARR